MPHRRHAASSLLRNHPKSKYDVLPNSPASSAGLRIGDQVVSIDGKPLDGFAAWDWMERRLRRGEEARLTVNRFAEETVTLTVAGAEPQREAILYYDWQLAFAAGCVVFIILLVATQPLRPLLSLWRPILLNLSGLTAVVVLLLTNWRSPWGSELFDRHWPVDDAPYPVIQVAVYLVVAFVQVALGTWEIRKIVQTCQGSSLQPGQEAGNSEERIAADA
jgi:hypothetical protein